MHIITKLFKQDLPTQVFVLRCMPKLFNEKATSKESYLETKLKYFILLNRACFFAKFLLTLIKLGVFQVVMSQDFFHLCLYCPSVVREMGYFFILNVRFSDKNYLKYECIHTKYSKKQLLTQTNTILIFPSSQYLHCS